MRRMLCTTALLMASPITFATTLEELCLGPVPDATTEAGNRALYDSRCAAVREGIYEKWKSEISSKSESERDKERTATSADVDLLKKIDDLSKPASTTTPGLDAFGSAAKKYSADLAYVAGTEITSQVLRVSFPPDKNSKVLVTHGAEQTANWMSDSDLKKVDESLGDIIDLSTQSLSRSECLPVQKTRVLAKSFTGVAAGVAAANVVLNGVSGILQLFKPQVSNGAKIESPEGTDRVVVAGLESELNRSHIATTSQLPMVYSNNRVVVRATQAETRLTMANKRLESLKSYTDANKVIDPACVSDVSDLNNIAGEKLSLLIGSDSKAGTPSAIERAARAQAIKDAGITHVLNIDLIMSGGGVAGYQRNRFSAVKLVASSDIAIVARLYDVRRGESSTLYNSFGCGTVIPLGEFSSEYGKTHCSANRE